MTTMIYAVNILKSLGIEASLEEVSRFHDMLLANPNEMTSVLASRFLMERKQTDLPESVNHVQANVVNRLMTFDRLSLENQIRRLHPALQVINPQIHSYIGRTQRIVYDLIETLRQEAEDRTDLQAGQSIEVSTANVSVRVTAYETDAELHLFITTHQDIR